MAIHFSPDERFGGVRIEYSGTISEEDGRRAVDALAQLPDASLDAPVLLDFSDCDALELTAGAAFMAGTFLSALSVRYTGRDAAIVMPAGRIPRGFSPERIGIAFGHRVRAHLFRDVGAACEVLRRTAA